jgi:hypothetical protein
MARTYTYAELNEKNNAELRQICQDLNIPGMSKKRKDEIVEVILTKAGASGYGSAPTHASPSKYTRAGLVERSNSELREICQGLGITGMSKKSKDVLVDTIIAKTGSTPPTQSTVTGPKVAGISSMEITMKNTVTNENSSTGRIKSTIHVSCGASAGNFAVVGKTAGQVAEFLKEVLNIGSSMPRALVNGKEVELNYAIKDGDNLEYLKSSGKKG